jgi:hypothetical protein
LRSMYLSNVTEWKSFRYNIIFTAFHLLTDPVHHRTEGRYQCAGYCRGNYYIVFTHTLLSLLIHVTSGLLLAEV